VDFEVLIENVLNALAAGITIGCIYGLMCTGLGLIFGVMKIVNFAQGELLMLGMFASLYLVTGGGVLAFLGPYIGPFVGALCAGPIVFIGGALLCTWLGFAVDLPIVLHTVVCVLGAFAGGAITGWVVGFLKAKTGAHEVIVTIMLNYVMEDFLSWILGTSGMQRPGRTDLISPFIAGNAHLPLLLGSRLRVNASFLLAIACAVGVWWLLNRSTIGFEFRTVGANPSAARTAGISVERTWILVMLIAGGLAGLASTAIVQGTDFSLNFQSYGTYGIDAITVALLGRARPLGVVLAALLFGALHAGGNVMQATTTPQVPLSLVQVIQGLVVLFVAAPPLVRAIFRLHKATAGGAGPSLAKGWNG
jgi:simple sugar transport system permease protein